MDEVALGSRIDEIAARIAGSDARNPSACRARLADCRRHEADIEFKIALHDAIAQTVFLSLCVVFGLTPYRVPRQRTGDACIRAPRSFVLEVFWPQCEAMAKAIEAEALTAVERVMEKWSGESLDQLAGHVERPGARQAR